MRNGNFFSYIYIPANFYLCSYPTYEEWKLRFCLTKNTATKCSYPTYEEWKLLLLHITKCHFFIVLILPMRNGNKILSFMQYSREIVLILPMRNGNLLFLSFYILLFYCSYPTYEEWKPDMLFAISMNS